MRDRIIIALIIAVTGAFLALAFMAARSEHRKKQKCRDAGGQVELYNCSTTYVDVSCGSGCSVSMPIESCDWRCKGAAEEIDP